MAGFRMLLNKNLQLITYPIPGVLYITFLYFIWSVILSAIPVNKNVYTESDHEMYILSNGVHLDLVLPLKDSIKDWTETVNFDKRLIPYVNYISFGWGDRSFYEKVPEWSDLTIPVALRAVFLKSEGALHVNFYKDLTTNEKCRHIYLDSDTYLVLIKYIEESFIKDSIGKPQIIENLSYGRFDSFYEAHGSYSLFFTCNTWTNSALKKSGLKASLWTPFDRGTLFHYRKTKYEKPD